MALPLNPTIMFSNNQAEKAALENKLPETQTLYCDRLELHKGLNTVLSVMVLFPVLLTFLRHLGYIREGCLHRNGKITEPMERKGGGEEGTKRKL